jgi:hypothetical protein
MRATAYDPDRKKWIMGDPPVTPLRTRWERRAAVNLRENYLPRSMQAYCINAAGERRRRAQAAKLPSERYTHYWRAKDLIAAATTYHADPLP